MRTRDAQTRYHMEEKARDRQIRVLLVDDEQGFLDLASLLLGREPGIRVSVARSAEQALGLLERGSFDVIIADYLMPGIDGIELVRRIRSAGDSTPYIVLSGKGGEDVAIEALRSGASLYLQKGADLKSKFVELAIIVRQLADHWRADSENLVGRQLSTALANADMIGIVVLSRSGRVRIWNTGMEKISGVGRAEAVGKSIFTILPSLCGREEKNNWMAQLKMKGSKFVQGVKYRVEKTSRVGFLDVYCSVLKNEAGEVTGILGLLVDRTSSYLADTMIKESEETYRIVFDNISDTIIVHDLRGNILEINAAGIGRYGRPREDLLKMNLKDLLAPDAYPFFDEATLNELANKGSLILNCTQLGVDGSRIPVEVSARLVNIQGTEAVLSVIRNAPEVRTAERALIETREFHEVVLEGLFEGVFVTDPKGIITYVNSGMERIVGVEKERILGANIHTDLNKASHGAFIEKFAAAEETQRPVFYENIRMTTLGGKEKYLTGWLIPLHHAGMPSGVVCTVNDVTDHVLLDQKLAKELRLNQALARVAEIAVSPGADIVDISSAILDEAKALTGAEHGFVGSIDVESGCLFIHTFTKMLPTCKVVSPDKRRVEFPKGQDGLYPHLWGYALNSRSAFFTNDPCSHPASGGVPEGHVPILNYLAVPSVYMGEVVGEIALANAPSGFSERDIETVSHLAELHALAVQRVRVESALKISEARFQRFMSHSPAVALIKDAKGKYLYVNAAWEKLIGAKASTIIGKYDYEFWPEDVAKTLRDDDAIVLRTKRALETIEKFPTPHGFVTTLVVKFPLLDEENNVVGVGGFAVDITEREKARRAIEESEAKLRSLFDNVSDALFITDLEGAIIEVNQVAIDRLGFSRDELLKMTHGDICAPEAAAGLMEVMADVIETGHRLFETLHVTKDGRKIPVEESNKIVALEGKSFILTSARDITRRRAAEAIAKLSQEKFYKAFRHSPDMILILKLPEGEIIEANDAVTKILNIKSEEVIGKKVQELELISESVYEELLSVFMQKGVLKGAEVQFRTRSGSAKYGLASAEMIEVAGQTCALVVVSDITDRKESEDALKEMMKALVSFQNMINASPAVAFVWRNAPGWPVQFVSENVEANFGYTRADILTNPGGYASLVHPDDLPRVASEVNEYLKRNVKEFVQEYRIFSKDGKVRWIEDRTLVIKDESGNVSHLQGIVLDVTEQRESVRKLAESERMFKLLAENAKDLIFRIALKPSMKFEYVSPSSLEITGYSPEEHYADPELGFKIVHPDDRQKLADLATIDRDIPGPIRLRWIRKDGRIIWTEQLITLIRDEEGAVVAMEGVSRDITERVMVEEALRQANSKLGLLGSITRHDVLNSVSVLSGYLSLAEGAESLDKAKEYSRRALDAVAKITRQLEFAGDYQKAGTVNPEWINLKLAFANALASVEMGAISVEDRLADYDVFADPMLEKVFINLMDNTKRHAVDATRFTISTSMRGSDLVIVAEDNGKGVSDVDRPHLFEKGYGKHTGLGLFLTREILSITGINIEETGSEGRGARFEITVPPGRYKLRGKHRRVKGEAKA